jgi:hypothetical protein
MDARWQAHGVLVAQGSMGADRLARVVRDPT